MVPHESYSPRRPSPLLIPLLLAVLVLTACGDKPAPAKPEGFNLTPNWRGQEIVEIREERVEFQGPGPFPAAADLEAGAKKKEREVDVYRDTVLTGTGVKLDAIHRRYLSSVLTTDDQSEKTAVDGNSYLITDPLGACNVQKEVAGGMGAATPEEQKKIRRSIIRIAASLLPKKLVREGESWRPGRDLRALALQGKVEGDMRARLQSVEEKEERKVATVTCEMDVRIPEGERIGANISARETLLFDIDGGRVSAYHASTERYYPPAPRREEGWVKTVTDVTVTKQR